MNMNKQLGLISAALELPFREGQWHTVGDLRAAVEKIIADRKRHADFSAKLRTQFRFDVPWAKSWNEEFFPLKLFADHKKLSDDDSFRWTPSGAADFAVRTSNNTLDIQRTMAYPEWPAAAGKHAGQLHHLEMRQFNAQGYSYGGGLISRPHARGPEEDLEAWRSGIKNALTNKLRPGYDRCGLLIFASGCQFDTVDSEFGEAVRPAVDAVVEWRRFFEAIYVLDAPSLAFSESHRD